MNISKIYETYTIMVLQNCVKVTVRAIRKYNIQTDIILPESGTEYASGKKEFKSKKLAG